ncbi:MAG: hypothetical protein M1825_000608 [Sarcosagium campestre]|nr:MAG: hypothetical protein M1825_000608 [Sarcosagium campestre]
MATSKEKEKRRPSSATPVDMAASGRVSHRAPTLDNTSSAPQSGPAETASKQSRPSLVPSSSTELSPDASREPSPNRPSLRPTTTAKPPRSRQNSGSSSPSRSSSVPGPATNAPSVPSAAAVQRALSAANAPSLAPSTLSDAGRISRDRKRVTAVRGDGGADSNAPPRLKSPPSSSTSRSSSRKAEHSPVKPTTPSIAVPRTSQPQPAASGPSNGPPKYDGGSESENESLTVPIGMRTPVRGASGGGPTLETVQESSLPSTPAKELVQGQGSTDPSHPARRPGNDINDGGGGHEEHSVGHSGATTTEPAGEDIDSDSDKSDDDDDGAGRNKGAGSGQGAAGTAKAKGAGEVTVQSMTVETETVSSIPQVAIAAVAAERGGVGRGDGGGGSLRMKPSMETIRPKKDKKRAPRKAPSINTTTGGYFRRSDWVPAASPPSNRPCASLPSSSPSELFFNKKAHFSARRDSVGQDGERRFLKSQIEYVRSRLTKYDYSPGSSKADVFEAKVANAVDEANSSDSEETFVYESNPPDHHHARPGRYHSRTPSATSMQSQVDHQRGGPVRTGAVDGHHTVAGKRSMKFANSAHSSSALDSEGVPTTDGVGLGRGSARGAGSNSAHHHHIGQWGRSGRGQHTSLFDRDSPFSQAQGQAHKSMRSGGGANSRHSSRPSSPKGVNHLRLSAINGKQQKGPGGTYDIDVEGADDERTPLVGSIRSNRSRGQRYGSGARPNGYGRSRRRSWIARCAYCLLLTIMALLVITGAVGFLFATTTPLSGVHVLEIQNVLASEQEIMLDILVEAVNPNIVSVTVGSMDVNLFAKSKHVGMDELSEADTSIPDMPKGIDEGTDPMPDPSRDSQTMLLGRIFDFDSALTFDGSPIKHNPTSSVGEVRLAKPGNKTEEGGTARWEGVIQHPFELIIRGVIKYQLPLSSRVRTSPIGASVTVHPEKGVDKQGRMELEQPAFPTIPRLQITPGSAPVGEREDLILAGTS